MRRKAISAPLRISAAILLPATLAGCATSSTYGTGEAPEMAMFREMTGGLLSKGEKKDTIDYQPRAPLVLPPAEAAQLPAPIDTAAAASPDWPTSREERIAAATAANEDDNPLNDVNQAEYRRLKPLAGAFPGQGQTRSYTDDEAKADYYDTVVHGREQRRHFREALADAEGLGSTGERRYLTDPPLEYRQPIPTAPSGPDATPKKRGNFLTRWFHHG